MSLLLAPYNNAMRIGQGFNSYTQQICIDDAVVVDPERLVNVLTNDGFTMDNLRTSLVGDVNLSATEEHPKTSVKRGPSQIVTYSSRFVDKLSEITDDMNISGSLSIKYGAIGGSGRGSFINSDKFKESDLNFYISVKVINQTINIKDALKYQKLPSVNENNFTDIYGDSFLSGFLEGGEFNALVSMKVLNKDRKTDIKAGAKVALSVGGAGIEAEANVKIAKQNISNNTEMTIQVSWSGGGSIKPMNEPWTIDTLRAAAAKFPELVATTPQRTYAILTKYETLRSFLALRPEKLIPIYYENATIYTSSLGHLHGLQEHVSQAVYRDSGTKCYVPMTETAADSTTLSRIDDERKFSASYKGVDLAKRACMFQMMKIVREVEEITKKPGLATHLGADAPGDKTAVLDLRPDLNEKVIACTVEVGRAAGAAGDKPRARVTALRLHTNRGPGLLGQADDWRPAAAGGKGVRGGAAFEELALAHFDPALERGHLKGFWGRARNAGKPHPQAGLYRLGPVWGSVEGRLSGVAAAPPLDDEPAGAVVPAGVWSTAEVRPWDKPVPHTAAVVSYAAATPDGPGVPAVVVGLACVDAMGAANLRCAAYAESVAPRDFAINVDSWADSQVYQAKLAWLGVPTGDAAKFQVGRFDTRAPVVRDIKFGRAFRKSPTVVVWLSGLDEEKNKGIRVNAYASDTTAAGFKMHVDCWDKSVLYWASLSWVAFSEDTGVVAGSYKVDIGADLARKKQERRAVFPPGKFAKPPRVVAAFNHLDLNAFTAANVRVTTEVEDVTVEGFRYSMSCWADSQLHYTTATWLALPSP
ncbi:hypothetical protein SLS56_008715 [Neofusicoccum ribis]|uniref:H-type lectin domain-containing protein n=1 Tax=Neofusicoccum ribis TaxID=45134 RepID=A0ABR3SK33_9PEZI